MPPMINVRVSGAVPGYRHYRIVGRSDKYRDSQPLALAKLNPTIMQEVPPMNDSLSSLETWYEREGSPLLLTSL